MGRRNGMNCSQDFWVMEQWLWSGAGAVAAKGQVDDAASQRVQPRRAWMSYWSATSIDHNKPLFLFESFSAAESTLPTFLFIHLWHNKWILKDSCVQHSMNRMALKMRGQRLKTQAVGLEDGEKLNYCWSASRFCLSKVQSLQHRAPVSPRPVHFFRSSTAAWSSPKFLNPLPLTGLSILKLFPAHLFFPFLSTLFHPFSHDPLWFVLPVELDKCQVCCHCHHWGLLLGLCLSNRRSFQFLIRNIVFFFHNFRYFEFWMQTPPFIYWFIYLFSTHTFNGEIKNTIKMLNFIAVWQPPSFVSFLRSNSS